MPDARTRDPENAPTGNQQDNRTVDRNTGYPPKPRPGVRGRWGARLLALGAFALLASGISLGAWRYYRQHQEVLETAEHQRDGVPGVRVATVEPSPGIMPLRLPGTTAAFSTASIYARATGYIAKRNVDIGDRVKSGQLLAELAVPELDAQISQNDATLSQLKAALEQAKANQELAQVTWDRDKPLVEKGWVSKQQGTVDLQTLKAQQAAVSVAQANVAAQENQLRVLRQNRSYALIVAPFNGVITQRNVDVGSLVQGNTNTGTFLFEIMQKDVIRVGVYVPQDAAFGVAPGVDAIVRVPELPDREFPGKVSRIAEALQSGTRTLLTEIDIPNRDGVLPAGAYCTVELKIPRKTRLFIVPSEALIFDRDGLQVAVVTDGKAEIRKVRVTRDFGTRVEVDEGVKPGDQVILNPPATLVGGSKVQPSPEVTAAGQ